MKANKFKFPKKNPKEHGRRISLITFFQEIDETLNFSMEVHFCMGSEAHYAKKLTNASKKLCFLKFLALLHFVVLFRRTEITKVSFVVLM